jgi:NADH:ubiquinone oxidoreductase subunit F (NADH-binding)/NADH:ubiquinone oxidoreductase subunit E
MQNKQLQEMRAAHQVVREFPFEIVQLKKGYANRTLRVDLDKNGISILPVTQQMKDLWTGGKGFDLWLLFQEINKNTRWDSPENAICFSPGPLAGTCSFPGSGKTLVTTVSPLTNIVVDCNVGGYFGPFFKFAGFDALCIVGKAKDETILVIDAVKKLITLEVAPLESADSHLLAEEFTEMYADDELDRKNISVVSAGSAADHAWMGILNFSFWDWRRGCTRLKQAGRGGIGTVFRNKKLKALVIKNRGITPAWRIEESKVAGRTRPKTLARQSCARDADAIKAIIEKWNSRPERIVEMLIDIQAKYRHISRTAMDLLVKQTCIPLAKLYNIVTFYPAFSLEPKGEITIQVCSGGACQAKGAGGVLDAFERELKIKAGQTTPDGKYTLEAASCLGACEIAPVVKINDTLVGSVKPQQVKKILSSGPAAPAPEKKIAPVLAGIAEAVALREDAGEYRAFKKLCKNPQPEVIIDELRQSGLRGRGGGGFLTADKWAACRGEALRQKAEACLVCNSAAFEPSPHAVIEGMLIAALATGASEGHVCFRYEHAAALERFEAAVRQARDKGLLGKNILGSPLSFDLQLHRGPGGFVVGESSALLRTLAGNVGEPGQKYVHASEKGIRNRPTLVQNIETWALIPIIMEKGAGWFKGIGSGSAGTKMVALSGDCKYTGPAEVAMGLPLGRIVEEAGQGLAAPGRKLKALQVGGPSGGFIPADKAHLPLDYGPLAEAGAMVGSGAIVVKDSRKCLVDTTAAAVKFLLGESCGKCTPCREGLFAADAILSRLVAGKGSPGDARALHEIAETMAESSLCRFGKTAANPLLSSLRYFGQEYEEHISGRKCVAGVCKELVTYSINEKCTGCTVCAKNCPVNAISGERKALHAINQTACIKCGICMDSCKFEAVEVK